MLLRRLKHLEYINDSISKSKVSKCFCPYYDGNRFEKWYFIIANPNTNSVISKKHVSLNESVAFSSIFSKELDNDDEIFEKVITFLVNNSLIYMNFKNS